MNHSRRPWSVRTHDVTFCCAYVYNSSGGLICKTGALEKGVDENNKWSLTPDQKRLWAQDQADIHFIAAAPEMYDALVVARKALLGPDGNESLRTEALLRLGSAIQNAGGDLDD